MESMATSADLVSRETPVPSRTDEYRMGREDPFSLFSGSRFIVPKPFVPTLYITIDEGQVDRGGWGCEDVADSVIGDQSALDVNSRTIPLISSSSSS